MFFKNDVISFYEKYKIIPGKDISICNLNDYLVMLFSAFNKSESFGLFVRESLVAEGHNEFRLKFESWEELFDCYCSFMVGYSGNKS